MLPQNDAKRGPEYRRASPERPQSVPERPGASPERPRASPEASPERPTSVPRASQSVPRESGSVARAALSITVRSRAFPERPRSVRRAPQSPRPGPRKRKKQPVCRQPPFRPTARRRRCKLRPRNGRRTRLHPPNFLMFFVDTTTPLQAEVDKRPTNAATPPQPSCVFCSHDDAVAS